MERGPTGALLETGKVGRDIGDLIDNTSRYRLGRVLRL